jgi:hypothetical protein
MSDKTVTYESQNYRAEVTDGLLKVYSSLPRQIQVTTAEGSTVEPAPRSWPRLPAFAATYTGPRWCEVDLDCGMQRWSGPRSLLSVRKALGQCGFDTPQVNKLLGAMKSQEQGCPRYYG